MGRYPGVTLEPLHKIVPRAARKDPVLHELLALIASGLRRNRSVRPAVSEEAKKVRARKMIRKLRSLGYRVELSARPSTNPV